MIRPCMQDLSVRILVVDRTVWGSINASTVRSDIELLAADLAVHPRLQSINHRRPGRVIHQPVVGSRTYHSPLCLRTRDILSCGHQVLLAG